MTRLIRYPLPLRGPQGLAWDGESMWLTSAADGRLYAFDPKTWNIRHQFVPPHEALGITYTGSAFRVILAPAINEPDLERDRRYVYSFTPDAGFTACFPCPDFSGSFLAYANGTLYLSQAWDKKLIALNEVGAPVREVRLERRPVGMTIVDGAFYLATVDQDWAEGQLQRLGVDAPAPSIETLQAFPFKPRSVAYDGERFWVADRKNHAIVSFTLDIS
jgi:outer membrane protein assembly factor BamB